MNATFSLLALLVAVAAAVRSTWSPCGLSMLSTLTPIGERAKGHRYGATCTWFVLGATTGGLALGGVTGLLAAAVRTVGPSPEVTASVGLAAALAALASDTGLARVRLPVHYRQVNERWLDAYRPWVYGAGFGFQIGTGVATYITTAGVYLLVVLGALGGSPVAALAVGVTFGLVRGLAVTLTRRVATPRDLREFHRRFATRLPWAQRAVTVAVSVAVVVSAVAAWPASAAIVTSATVLTLVARRAVGARGDTGALRGGTGVTGAVPAAEPDRSVPVG
jgi:hypothetical protein